MNSIATVDAPPAAPRPASGAIVEMVRTYRRRLPMFLMVAGLVFLAVAAYTFAQSPRYTAETTVVVAPRKAEVGSDRSALLSDPTGDASVDTQVEVLRGPEIAAAVVDKLRLEEREAYRRLTHVPGLGERLGLTSPQAPPVLGREARRAGAIDLLQQSIDVHRVAQTFVLSLRFTSADPNLAAKIVNAFASAYVQQSLELKLEGAQRSKALLEAQLADARAELIAAEAAVGRYKVAHNLMSVDGITLAEQELVAFEQQVANAGAAEAEARARLSAARQQLARGSNGEDVGEALGSPVVQELRRQRAEAGREVAEYSSRYGARFPKLVEAQQQIVAIDGQIQSEIRRLISNLEAQNKIASDRAGAMEASLARSRGALASNNVAQVGLSELQMRANTARGLYEALLARTREIGTQAATTQPDARLTRAAPVPDRPSEPNVPINLLVGALLGIAGGIGAVVLRHGLDQGLSTLDDVEARLNMPYLAGLPTLASSLPRFRRESPVAAVVAHPQSAFAEGFRSLGAAVLQGSARLPVRTIALTSALPNEGKTTTAICLARVLAMTGKRVVLVDADLRRPQLAETLALSPATGLQEVIEGKAALDEALIADPDSDASILPFLHDGRPESAIIEDGRFDVLIETLKARFDIVIFDASPVLPVVDGRLLARKMDSVVLLARWRKTPESAVELAIHLLRQVGATATGVALSRVDLNALARSGYGDPAKFMKSYGSYYHM